MLTAELRAVKETVERDQEVIAKLHQSHANEVSKIKQEGREQLQSERERLLNQIRELTVMNAHTNAEVKYPSSMHTKHYDLLHNRWMSSKNHLLNYKIWPHRVPPIWKEMKSNTKQN